MAGWKEISMLVRQPITRFTIVPAAALWTALLAAGCIVGEDGDPTNGPETSDVSGAGKFGQTGTGTSFAGMSANGKRASEFTLMQSGVTVTKLTAYLDGHGATAGSQVGRGVIYAADGTGGAPGKLLCQTAEFSIAAGQAASWVDMAVSGTCTLATSGKYYLGIHTGGATSGVARYGTYAMASALHWSLNDSYADGPSNPWGVDSLSDVQMAIYATYQTTAVTGYEQAIAYTQSRPAFTPTRTINVSTASELKSALSNLRAGDLVKATAAFTVTGQTIISKRLPSWAVIDLSGYDVKFVYAGGQNEPAVYLSDAENIRLYGGEATTVHTGGPCILAHGSQFITWWGFIAHDCGASGFIALTSGAPVDHLDIQGEIWNVSQNLAWDPHAEKGTGLHCAGEFADAAGTYAFTNNRLAFYCHDIAYGNAFAFGDGQLADLSGNTLYLKAINLTFVAKTQTAGNAICLWGYTDHMGLDVKYVEVANATGYGLMDNGLSSGQTLSGVTVEYGRATNTNLNPRYAGQNPWKTDKGVVYDDVLPAP
jgi:hypothetical protein